MLSKPRLYVFTAGRNNKDPLRPSAAARRQSQLQTRRILTLPPHPWPPSFHVTSHDASSGGGGKRSEGVVVVRCWSCYRGTRLTGFIKATRRCRSCRCWGPPHSETTVVPCGRSSWAEVLRDKVSHGCIGVFIAASTSTAITVAETQNTFTYTGDAANCRTNLVRAEKTGATPTRHACSFGVVARKVLQHNNNVE
jgi:hypothetical protein